MKVKCSMEETKKRTVKKARAYRSRDQGRSKIVMDETKEPFLIMTISIYDDAHQFFAFAVLAIATL
jgi:hypothetical protein